MKLAFVYAPTVDLSGTAAFYADVLGFTEAWRDGDDTIAFEVPEGGVQVMVSTTPQPAGPMYLVDDLSSWLESRGNVRVLVPRFAIPGGSVVGLADAAGNVFYVFDQTG